MSLHYDPTDWPAYRGWQEQILVGLSIVREAGLADLNQGDLNH